MDLWNDLVKKYKDAANKLKFETRSGAEWAVNYEHPILQELDFIKDHVSNRPMHSTMGFVPGQSNSSMPHCGVAAGTLLASKAGTLSTPPISAFQSPYCTDVFDERKNYEKN